VGWLLRRPYLGLDLRWEGPAAVAAAVEEGSSADVVGVRSGDRVLAVGDVEVGTPDRPGGLQAFVLDVLDRHRAGEEVIWTVERDGVRRTVASPLRSLPAGLVGTHLLLYAVFWGVAFFLLFARPHDPQVRRLAWVVLATTAGNFFRPITDLALDRPLGLLLQEVCAAGRFLGPALTVHFAVSFPSPSLSARARRTVLALAYGIPGLLFLVEQGVIVRGALDPAAPYLLYRGVLADLHYWQIRFWVFLGSMLAAGILMVRSARRLPTARERAQVKWVVWSVLLAAAVDMVIVASALYVGGRYSDYVLQPYRNLVYLTIAIGLIVAVLRHDLFDVDRVIRGTLLYFISTATVFVVFAIIEEVISNQLQGFLAFRSEPLTTAFSGVIAAALFVPVRRWLDTRLPSPGPGVAERTSGPGSAHGPSRAVDALPPESR